MKKIQMVDLMTQYHHIKHEVDTAVKNVIESGAYIKGPAVTEFEQNLAVFTRSAHVISCGNGTDALQIAMMSLDFKPGDEVITVASTYVATVEVLMLLGLKPVFIDTDPLTFNMRADLIEGAITDKTVAILPVHLYGQSAPMHEIMQIAEKHNLFVIEDNAQAIGAEYTFPDGKKAQTGTIGHIGCTSFYPSKNLGAMGDGGALFTQEEAIAKKIRQIANHGQSELYQFDLIGVNSRLDSVQAAILNVKLKYLNQYIKARQQAAAQYDEAFKQLDGVKIPYRYPISTHVFHQYTLILEKADRDELKTYLADQGIPTMIYYPKPLHFYPAYQNLGYEEGSLPVSEAHSKKVISLPMHTELNEETQQYIIKHVIEFLT